MVTTQSRAQRAAKLTCLLASLIAIASCGPNSDSSAPTAAMKAESVQSFAGTVNCESADATPQSWSLQTQVILDRPVYREMISDGASAQAVQIGGLAGTLTKDEYSSVRASILPGSNALGGGLPALEFTVTANPASGTYGETGRWTIGVDQAGKATLTGDSTAMLGPVASGWRATCRWNLAAAELPVGPVSYDMIDRALTPPPSLAAVNGSQTLMSGSMGSCGSAWAKLTTAGYVASAILSVPTGGASIAALLSIGSLASSIAGGNAGDACANSDLANMNFQMAVQEAQIRQIYTYLNLASNVIFNAYWGLNLTDTANAYYRYEKARAFISPNGSTGALFSTWMMTLGLWDSYGAPGPDGKAVDGYPVSVNAKTDMMQIATDDTNNFFDKAASALGSALTPGAFQSALVDISGTKLNLSSTCTDCEYHVAPTTDSALLIAYQQLFTDLSTQVSTFAKGGNVVPLYDDYNALLVRLWTEAVYSMQQAYLIEWQINQLNFFRATSPTATPKTNNYIPQLGSGSGYYRPGLTPSADTSLQTETDNYNAAQRSLARLYAARINMLYQNTLRYIVSDVPVMPQAYPTNAYNYTSIDGAVKSLSVDYAGTIGKATPLQTYASGAQGPTPLSLVPSVANGEWQKSAVLYQFSGLKDVVTCINSLKAYTANNPGGTVSAWLQDPSACPSIFTLADGTPLSKNCPDVAAATSASPIAITTSSAHGLKTGNTVTVNGMPGGFAALNGNTYPVTRTSTTTFTVAVDGGSFATYTSAGRVCNEEFSLYDGNTLRPYTSFKTDGTTGNPLQLATALPYNLKFCDRTTPNLKWDKRGPMLNCGTWYVPQGSGLAFPRADNPVPNTDGNFYTDTGTHYGSFDSRVLGAANSYQTYCNNNQSFQGQKFPQLTALTGSWLNGSPSSCDAVIPTVNLYNTTTQQSPTIPDSLRRLLGNYLTGNTARGCSLGWVGTGLTNRLPLYPPDGVGTSGLFGLRLPRYDDPDNESGGFVLPLKVNGGCYEQAGYQYVYPLNYPSHPATDINTTGYVCNAPSNDTLNCTIIDGTKYTIVNKLVGQAWVIDVQVIK